MLQLATKWLAYGALLSGLVDGLQLKRLQASNDLDSSSVSNITNLTPEFFLSDKPTRQKITYGPFTVPGMDIKNGMADFVLPNVTVGCTNCTITYMAAGLEYPNGTYANANTSLWLHHMLLYNLNATDSVCGNATYPYPERFFASGNERSVVDLTSNSTDPTGYYVAPGTQISFSTELMNQAMANQTAIVTVTYETIPGLPSNFYKSIPIWLDIGSCTDSDVDPPANTPEFNFSSTPFISPYSGRISSAIGHVHDGGINLQMTANSTTFCNSTTAYAQTPGYIDNPSATAMMNMSLLTNSEMTHMGQHISSMSECKTGRIEKGDSLSVHAFYDFDDWTPMVNDDGSLAPIMGIGVIFIAVDEAGNGTTTSTGTATGTTTGTATGGVASSTSKAAGSVATMGPVAGLVGGVVGVAMLLV